MAIDIPNDADASTYPKQAEPDSADFLIISAGFARTGVLSGCGVTAQGSPDMTVAVAAGTVEIAGLSVAVTGGNLTIGANATGNPRFDLITVNTSGTKAVVAGTAASTPVFPAIPASRVVLAAVYVPSGLSAVTSAMIRDRSVPLASLPTPIPPFGASGVLSVRTGGMRHTMEESATIQSVRATVGTPPTGASIIVDVNKNGTTIFTGGTDRPTIAAGTNTDTGTPAVTSLAPGDYLTVDIDQVGSTIPGSDLTVTIRLTRA